MLSGTPQDDAVPSRTLAAHVKERWERVFTACPKLEIVKFDFDVDDHQGKVYVGLDERDVYIGLDQRGAHDVFYCGLSELTETYQLTVEEQRLRFMVHQAVWNELRAFPPLRYRPLMADHRELTRVEVHRKGIWMRSGLWTNWWPPTEDDCRFLPWSAQWYTISAETLRAAGVDPPADMEPWPPR